ncbi:MAG TPA: c-type cytochrome [Candidatus Udaeobacter sp.]|nr:c-type cytochrome [Candidatus Udaeobacter sp.]
MNRTAHKSFLVTSAVVVALAAALLAVHAQNPTQASAPQTGAPAARKTASQQFKNIQVLKDVPADQLIPAMQFITASLGVDCEYCHVEHAFDKDDKKPKVMARKMMEMMITINNENFESHRMVTCYTCHQGGAHPVSIPVIAEHEKTPGMMEGSVTSASGNPAAESLLEQYLAAVGGADALKKIKSRVAKGTVTAFGDQHMPIDIYSKAPDMRVSVMHMKEGESVTAYNGKAGWLSVPGRVHMMNAQESVGARMDSDFAFAANVKSLYTKWETLPGVKVDGHDTWLLIGRNEGQPPLKLYLDQKSNLLVRLIRYTDSPLGYNPTQIDYDDYRPADGVKTPYRWTIARPGNRFTVQVDDLKQNVPIDEATFVPPPPTLPPPLPAH